MDDRSSKKPSDIEKYNAELTYQHGLTLLQFHADLLWNQFNAFLIAVTVLIGFIGTSIFENKYDKSILTVGAAFGLVLCFFWFTTFKHNYSYYLLRVHQVKSVEEIIGIKLFIEGGKFYFGTKFEIIEEHPERKLKIISMKCIYRVFSPGHSFPIVIIMFKFLFLLVIFYLYWGQLIHFLLQSSI